MATLYPNLNIETLKTCTTNMSIKGRLKRIFPSSLLNDMPNGFKRSPLKVKNVIFNDPATIVFWNDGTKTVVKCENEEFDKEKGLAMAFMKKMFGNKGRYFNEVKKWTRQEMEGEDPHDQT